MRYLVAAIIVFALLPQGAGLPVCVQTVHDHARYRATGPDGATYPSYHPQIDQSGCAFDHEHGSDPALFDPAFKPVYGYSAREMPEGHAGFKGVAWEVGNVKWYATFHQGSSNAPLAACTRHHTLDLAIKDSAGLAADLHLMADFGRAEANGSQTPLATPCADQSAIPRIGVRQFPIAGGSGYEPWVASAPNNILGLSLAALTLNVLNPQTACDTLTCTVALPRTDPANGAALGTYRQLSAAAGLGVSGVVSGTLTTNAHGGVGVDTVQYIRPGFSISAPAFTCRPFNAFAYIYDCTGALWNEQPFRRNPFVTGAN